MPAVTTGAEQHPDITQAKTAQRKRCHQKTAQTLKKINRPTIQVGVHHLQAPGTHAQGLPAMGPEPVVEQEGGGHQQGEQSQLQIGTAAGGIHAGCPQIDRRDEKPQGNDNQGVVNDGGQSAQQAGRWVFHIGDGRGLSVIVGRICHESLKEWCLGRESNSHSVSRTGF